jgi:hypothetical protein
VRGEDLIRCDVAFAPPLERAHRVELVRPLAPAAVHHAGRHEQAVRLVDLVAAPEPRLDALVIVHAVERRNLLVVPAVVLNELPAAREERLQVRVNGVHESARNLVARGDARVEVERPVVPIDVVEHDVPEMAFGDRERLQPVDGIPAKLAAGRHAGKYRLLRSWIARAGVHLRGALDLRWRQA